MLTLVRIPLGVSSSRTMHSCVQCFGERAVARELSEISQDLNALAHQNPERFDGIVLEGFEPFAHPNLVEILQYACSLNLKRIALHTDGGALSILDNALGCMQMGARIFEINISGSNSATHDKISDSPGLFQAMLLGISNIRDGAKRDNYSIALIASLDVCDHNKNEFLDMVTFCLEKGFDAIRLRSGGELLDVGIINQAHAMATVQGVLLFGSHVPCLNGANLYEVREVGEC